MALVDAGCRFGLSPEVWTLSCGTWPHCGCHPAVTQTQQRQPSGAPENPAAQWTCWMGLGLRWAVTSGLLWGTSSQGLPPETDQPGKHAEGCCSTLGVPQPPRLSAWKVHSSQEPSPQEGKWTNTEPTPFLVQRPGCRGPLPSKRRSVLLVQTLEKAQTGQGPPSFHTQRGHPDPGLPRVTLGPVPGSSCPLDQRCPWGCCLHPLTGEGRRRGQPCCAMVGLWLSGLPVLQGAGDWRTLSSGSAVTPMWGGVADGGPWLLLVPAGHVSGRGWRAELRGRGRQVPLPCSCRRGWAWRVHSRKPKWFLLC